jgi:hypothetical protein
MHDERSLGERGPSQPVFTILGGQITTKTYQPAKPRQSATAVAEDVIVCATCLGSTICSGNHEDKIETKAKGHGPVLLQLIPVTRVNLFRYPKKKIPRVEIARDALKERATTYKSRHGFEKRLKYQPRQDFKLENSFSLR